MRILLIQVDPDEHERMIIENIIESPGPIDSGDELTIVDNEDRIVNDIALSGVDVQSSAADIKIAAVGSVRRLVENIF